ncbi:hypothetical protein D1871_17875 [Nakamurella silvestris]|nr:hypothetical protein D1871_17875 [Nakamurella silvestris]
MDIRDRLMELEVHAPDPEEVRRVLAERRTQSRRRVRLLSIVGVAAAVCAIAGGTILVSTRTSGDQNRAAALPPASQSVHAGPASGPVVYNSMDGWTWEKSDLFSPIMNDIGKAGLRDQTGGFAVTSVNYLTDTGLVYWHGEMSQEARQIITAAAARGIHIEQVQVPFGERQLVDAVSTVDAAFQAAGIAAEPVGLDDSYSGLLVAGQTVLDDQGLQQRARAVAEAAVPGIKLSFVPLDDAAATNFLQRVTRPPTLPTQ